MDTAKHKPIQNSRWDPEPVLDSRGRPRIARLTERDIEIFKLLPRYRFPPLDDLHAFVGAAPQNWQIASAAPASPGHPHTTPEQHPERARHCPWRGSTPSEPVSGD